MLDRLNNLNCFVTLNSHLWSVFIPFYSFLNPDFNCSKHFLSFSVDKVTTGTYNFVSDIWNSNSVDGLFASVVSAKTQFLDQVKINCVSQLINSIKFSKKCLNVLMVWQLQFYFYQLCFHHNQHHQYQDHKYSL